MMRAIAIWTVVALASGGMTARVAATLTVDQQPIPQAAPGRPQPAPGPAPPAPGPAQPAPQPGQKPGLPPPEPRREREPAGKPVNLLIEVTIADRTGNEPPSQKLVSVVTADATVGRVRATTQQLTAQGGFVPIELNVDARPQLLTDTSLKLQLTLEYTPSESFKGDEKSMRPTRLHETLNVILQNGKPLLVSQAADPSSDRRITVEVKATIMK